MAAGVTTIPISSQNQVVIDQSGGTPPGANAVTPAAVLVGPDGVTPISTNNPLAIQQVSTAKGTTTFFTKVIGTTADEILAANPARKSMVIVFNTSLYIDNNSGVTASGSALFPAGSISDEDSTSAWWGVVANGTCEVSGFEIA